MKYCKCITILTSLIYILVPVTLLAIDENQDAAGLEEPSFTNPAQAQHAENIAANSNYDEETIADQAEKDAQDAAEAEAENIAAEAETEAVAAGEEAGKAAGEDAGIAAGEEAG